LIVILFNLPNLKGFELVAVCLMGILLVPVLEELLFRGIIYQSLRTKVKPLFAIPISAFLFAAVHMELSALLPIFVAGCIMAYTFERAKSLYVPIAIHCLNNTIALTVTLLTHD